jgi:hypothetical protein
MLGVHLDMSDEEVMAQLWSAGSFEQRTVKARMVTTLLAQDEKEIQGFQLVGFAKDEKVTLITERTDGWCRVKNSADSEGWCPTSHLLLKGAQEVDTTVAGGSGGSLTWEDVWAGITAEFTNSVKDLKAKSVNLDEHFALASIETKALHADSFTDRETVMHFLRENWHSELLEDDGVVEKTTGDKRIHDAKDLFFRAVVDNDEIPFILGRARAWTVSVQNQVNHWLANIGSFNGAKLLHGDRFLCAGLCSRMRCDVISI